MTASDTRITSAATKLQPAVLAGFRIVVSFFFILHGCMGLFGAFGGVDGQGGTVSFPAFPEFWGSAIPFGTGILILLGIFTRPVAVLASGTMAYAYFTVHAPLGLWPMQNGGELAALFSWIFLTIAVVGPGALALDNLRRKAS